jgi:hypothetical protein
MEKFNLIIVYYSKGTMGMCMAFQRCLNWRSLEDDEFPYSNLMSINVEEA